LRATANNRKQLRATANRTERESMNAQEWLKQTLQRAGGAMPAARIFDAAASDGVATIHVSRARRQLGVAIEFEAGIRNVTWRLGTPDHHPAPAADGRAPIVASAASAASPNAQAPAAMSPSRVAVTHPTSREMRERIDAIVQSEAAHGREALAMRLALIPNITVGAALAILRSAARAPGAEPAPRFQTIYQRRRIEAAAARDNVAPAATRAPGGTASPAAVYANRRTAAQRARG
jgi:hypothetical protein